jgi:DNA polymerase-3 subunit alpha
MPADSEAGKWRACLFAAIDTVLSFAQREREDRIRGQNALFGGGTEAKVEEPLPDAAAWTQADISRLEKSSVGFYLSVHPLDNFNSVLAEMSIRNVGDYDEINAGQNLTLAGIVSAAQVRHSKKGNRFCVFRLEDRSASVKCLAWAEAFNKYGHLMKDDQLLVVHGRVESADGQEITFIVGEAKLLADAAPQKARSVCIALPEAPDEEYLNDLLSVLNASDGRCEVLIEMQLNGVSIQMRSQPVRVQGSYALEQALRERGCDVRWQL